MSTCHMEYTDGIKMLNFIFQFFQFQDFYIKPCLLIIMHDIDTKNNRAHLCAMGYLGITYSMTYIPCIQ